MRVLIAMLIVLAFLAVPVYAETIEVEREMLEEIAGRIEKDGQTIKELRANRAELEQRIVELEAENDKLLAQTEYLKSTVKGYKGFFIGGGLNWPLPSADAILLYRFQRFSPYIHIGLQKDMRYGAGVLFKLGGRK